MNVLKRRSRLVTFRVSADEYAALVNSCIASGSRSVAEFVREAALDKTQSAGNRDGTLSGNLNTLTNALSELDESLLEAHKRIQGVLGIRANQSIAE